MEGREDRETRDRETREPRVQPTPPPDTADYRMRAIEAAAGIMTAIVARTAVGPENQGQISDSVVFMAERFWAWAGRAGRAGREEGESHEERGEREP